MNIVTCDRGVGRRTPFTRGCDSIFVTTSFPTISQVKGVRKIAHKRKRQNQGTPNKASFVKNFRSGQRSGI
ncbi:hypothetical protein, partial [Enterococcus faecium]|uniref:hypothetical protein n=1 Tax=Enterococcus faecium TaxID=1352 RepID=UPI0019D35A7E